MAYDFRHIEEMAISGSREVGLKWPLGEDLGVEVKRVCQGTGGDD